MTSQFHSSAMLILCTFCRIQWQNTLPSFMKICRVVQTLKVNTSTARNLDLYFALGEISCLLLIMTSQPIVSWSHQWKLVHINHNIQYAVTWTGLYFEATRMSFVGSSTFRSLRKATDRRTGRRLRSIIKLKHEWAVQEKRINWFKRIQLVFVSPASTCSPTLIHARS